jgi:hypothetical protein
MFRFQYVSLINPNSKNLLSHGYQVLFKINSDTENQMYLLCNVADKYGLAVEIEKEGLIIIYRPMKKERHSIWSL